MALTDAQVYAILFDEEFPALSEPAAGGGPSGPVEIVEIPPPEVVEVP